MCIRDSSSTVPSLGTSFGRGGATGFLQDLANADCIVIQGSNMAECHPVGFQWVMEAKARGAKIIHVDPRFTRTSAVSDLHVPLRAGSDIAFVGGLINYVLSAGKEFREYVTAYTNASTIVGADYVDSEDLGGLFSGWDDETHVYDPSSWAYEGVNVGASAGKREEGAGAESAGGESGAQGAERSKDAEQSHQFGSGGASLGEGAKIQTDPTLTHPRCVFQVLKRHFARYTPEMVQEVCGVPPELFGQVAEALTDNSGWERTSAFCYAVGWTHHSTGVQYIRTAAPASKARPTSRRCTTSCRATCRCRTPTSTRAWIPTSSATARPPATGPTCGPTRSVCSRRTGAMPPPPRTTSASTTCPA